MGGKMQQYRCEATEDDVRGLLKEMDKVWDKIRELNFQIAGIKEYVEDKFTELTSIPEEYKLDSKEECHIYFIRCEGAVKVGYSRHPGLRLRALQTANPKQLELLYSFLDFQRKEKEIHCDLEKHSINGEWFEHNDFVRNYIKTLQTQQWEKTKGKK